MSKIIVSENYLTDIANSIRNKNGASTTKYKPSEMSPAIDALQMKDDSQLIGLLNGSLTTFTVPDSVTSIRSNAFINMSNLKTININKDYNGISGINWGATNATVNWLKGTKYPITIIQSPNETITVTVDGKSYTSSFEYYKGATLTATVTADKWYKAGALSASSVTVSGPVTFTVGEATKEERGTKFTFNKNNNMGPIGLIVDSTTYILNGYNASSYPLFAVISSTGIFNIIAKYDSSVTPAITTDLFSSDGALYNFFNNHEIKLTIESSGFGLLWSSPNDVAGGAVYGRAYWRRLRASAASMTGDWTTTSSNSADIIATWNKLVTAYSNGDNLVVEFLPKS